MAKVTLDLTKLVAQRQLSADEAARLESLGEPTGAAGRVIANVLLIFGAIAVAIGVVAMEPPLEVGLALALVATGAGGTLVYSARDEWGLLGHALVLMGGLGVAGWAFARFDTLPEPWPHYSWHVATIIALVGAFGLRNAVLAALAPIALGHVIGSGTDYWHASYLLFVREATVSIALFGGLAAALFWARPMFGQVYRLAVTVMARMSFFLANFGFWVGSLWGDYPGEMWAIEDGNGWRATSEWREQALYIPDWAFSLGWAAFLFAALLVGVRTGRRFVANTAIVFLAIHGYTQLFETLGAEPVTLLTGGLVLVVLGFGVARFDRWLKTRAGAPAAA